ncbi:MAG: amidohydrolase family protein [Polyangiaceae bacterium]|nr:amidohydrolase family protein [Polyangiaceae bacterium]
MSEARKNERRSLWKAGVLAAFLGAAASALIPGAPASAQPAPPRTGATAKTPAAPKVIAIVNALVHTGTGEILEDASVIIAGNTIREVGRGIAAPAGAEVIAVKGSVVTPGLVEPLTSIGLVEISLEDATRDDEQGGDDPIRAGFRASDGYNPASSVIPITRAEGITSVGAVPTGGLIAGQSAWVDLTGATAAEAIAQAPLAIHVNLAAEALKSGGHATAILRVREAFDDARVFARTRAAWERNQSRRFAPSRLDLEALALATAPGGRVPVVFHVHRAADILAALGVAKEMGLRAIIAGGAEAWKVKDALAAGKTPVIVLPFDSDPVSFDTIAAREDNAAILHAAGVPLAISTGSTHDARKLRQAAGNAVRAGLPHAAAITALTRGAAEAFGMGARYGTLAKGLAANVVVWSADPLEVSSRPVHVMIRGQAMSLRTRQTELFERYRKAP